MFKKIKTMRKKQKNNVVIHKATWKGTLPDDKLTLYDRQHYWVLMLVLIAMIVLCGWNVFRFKENHSIYLYFPTAVWLEEPDTLDIYVDGELIRTISTEAKAVEKIEYNSLEPDDRVTVYSHVLGQTYVCETIEEHVDDMEKTIAEAASWPMSRAERAEHCAHANLGVGIDYLTKTMSDGAESHSYEELLDGVCKVNLVLENAEVITEDEALLLVCYAYDDCACILSIPDIENGQIKEVVPADTEYIYYNFANEADEILLKGKFEVNGRSSVDIVIDFAKCEE